MGIDGYTPGAQVSPRTSRSTLHADVPPSGGDSWGHVRLYAGERGRCELGRGKGTVARKPYGGVTSLSSACPENGVIAALTSFPTEAGLLYRRSPHL